MKKFLNIIISIILILIVAYVVYIAFVAFYAKPKTLETDSSFTVEDTIIQ